MNVFASPVHGSFPAGMAPISVDSRWVDPLSRNHRVLDTPYIDGLLAMGFIGGMISFFKGFRDYRTYRVIRDVPVIPIRSVAMGLVHVTGRAVGESTVVGPVSQTPCLSYLVVIEVWSSGRWARVKARDSGTPFTLEDATGRILVDLRGASFILRQSAQCEMDPVSAYAAAAGAADLVAPGAIGARDLSGGRCRLTEFLILPGVVYDVTGACAPNPLSKDEHDRNLIGMGQEASTFLISDEAATDTRAGLRHSAAAKVFGSGILAILCLAALLAHYGFL